MRKWDQMTREEKLAAIGAAANGGEMTPEAKAYVEAARQNSSQKGWNLPIVKPVDPEAEISARMANEANTLHPAIAPSTPPPGSVEARQTINPVTGLPFSIQDVQPTSPEEAQRQEEMRFKMQYYKNRAQGQ